MFYTLNLVFHPCIIRIPASWSARHFHFFLRDFRDPKLMKPDPSAEGRNQRGAIDPHLPSVQVQDATSDWYQDHSEH